MDWVSLVMAIRWLVDKLGVVYRGRGCFRVAYFLMFLCFWQIICTESTSQAFRRLLALLVHFNQLVFHRYRYLYWYQKKISVSGIGIGMNFGYRYRFEFWVSVSVSVWIFSRVSVSVSVSVSGYRWNTSLTLEDFRSSLDDWMFLYAAIYISYYVPE